MKYLSIQITTLCVPQEQRFYLLHTIITCWYSGSIIQPGRPGGGPEVEQVPSTLSLRAFADTPGPGLRARSYRASSFWTNKLRTTSRTLKN